MRVPHVLVLVVGILAIPVISIAQETSTNFIPLPTRQPLPQPSPPPYPEKDACNIISEPDLYRRQNNKDRSGRKPRPSWRDYQPDTIQMNRSDKRGH